MNVFTNISVYSLAAAGDEESVKDLSLIRVWSVPAITVTRRLDGIKGDEGSELITFKEHDNTTDIYFREEIQEYQRAMVNFKLAEHFSSQFEIKSEDANFLTLLLSAPIRELPAIMEYHMENHNRFLSGDRDNGDSGSDSGESARDATTEGEGLTPVEPGEECHNGEDGNEPDTSDKDESGDDQLEVASESTDRQAECENPSAFTSANTQCPQTLRELVPSHQSKTESVAQRQNASEYLIPWWQEPPHSIIEHAADSRIFYR